MDPKIEISLLLFLALFGGMESKCSSSLVDSCQDQLMPDSRHAFDRNPKVKCRGVRNYLQCVEKDQECLTDDIHANLIKYMDSIKLKCTGLNGETDDFQHGCQEDEMDICEKNLQTMASEHAERNTKEKQEIERFMCTALSWTKLCMIENASCSQSVVEILAEETERAFGYKCASSELVSTTTLLGLSISLTLFVNRR